MLLFISHSGSDTEDAVALKRRILETDEARRAKLDVWLDVDDLVAGREWQPQLEEAVEAATAFCVYIGSRGVVNWVDREVRLGLTRSTGERAIPFIPIRASDSVDWQALPPFARQFHGITNPLGDESALIAFLEAVIKRPEGPVVLITEPFVGLRAMDEGDADRFFGRDSEVSSLAALVRAYPVVAVVADSGAGKSSLVRAGLVPAFRGGQLVDDERALAQQTRVAIVIRPGSDPVEGLRNGVDRAARAAGLDATDRRSLRQGVDLANTSETAISLRLDMDADQAEVLLVIDQFEELLTQTDANVATAFVDLMLALVEPAARRNIRIVLTVRADYFNLIRRHEHLFQLLESGDRSAQLRLQRITENGLADVVQRPLVMAGNVDEDERATLLRSIRRDTTDRPGDLALVQMALYATWRFSQREGIGLLRAYSEVHGVLGALAFEAEKARVEVLDADEQKLLTGLFSRLVRLGDTGGATRRIAMLNEFDAKHAALARKLATEDVGRLLMTTDQTVELAHEALIRQWPWLQSQIQDCAADIRILGRLSDITAEWCASEKRAAALPNDAERKSFEELAKRHWDWLSSSELKLLNAARRSRTYRTTAVGVAGALIIASAVAAVHFAVRANAEAESAVKAEKIAIANSKKAEKQAARADAIALTASRNASEALVALARIEADKERGDPVKAAKLALAAWAGYSDSDDIQIRTVLDILGKVVPRLREQKWLGRNYDKTNKLRGQFSSDGRFLMSSYNSQVTLYDSRTGKQLHIIEAHPYTQSIAFSPDGKWFAASSYDEKPFLLNLDNQTVEMVENLGNGVPSSVNFSPDSKLLIIGTDTEEVYFWNIPEQKLVWQQKFEVNSRISHVVISPDSKFLALGGSEGQIIVKHLVNNGRTFRMPETRNSLVWLGFDQPSAKLIAAYSAVARGSPAWIRAWDVSEVPQAGLFHATNLRGDEAAPGRADPMTGFSIDITSGYLTIGSENGTVEIYKNNIKESVSELVGHSGAIRRTVVSKDGEIALTIGTDGTVRVWDLESGKELARFEITGVPAADAQYLDDGRIRIGYLQGMTRIFDIGDAQVISQVTLDTLTKSTTKETIGPFSTRIISKASADSDSRIEVVDDSSGRSIVTIKISGELFRPRFGASHTVTPTGNRVAARLEDGTIEVHDLENGQSGTARTAIDHGDDSHFGYFSAMAFSPDGQLLAVGSGGRGNGSIYVMDSEDGSVIRAPQSTRGGVSGLSFSSDGQQLLVLEGYNGINVLNVAPQISSTDAWPSTGGWDDTHSFITTTEEMLLLEGDSRLLTTEHRKDAFTVWDTATRTPLANFKLPDSERSERLIGQEPRTGRVIVAKEDYQEYWSLASIPNGNIYNVTCNWLPDHSLSNLLEESPITIDRKICEPGYDPPMLTGQLGK